jgi:IclR family transcriptional regulator, KDG regulon repressor
MYEEKSQSLSRVVKILDSFSIEKPELGVREVARTINLSTSVTGRLMIAMKEMGILSQNSSTKLYSVGTRPLVWAGVFLANCDVRSIALPYMEELHQITRETISLYILDGNERVCVERLESTQNVRIVARIGRRLPLYAGSAGKAFLAYLSAARQEEIINSIELIPYTPNTIVDKNQLMQELEKIHHQGYSVSHGEWMAEASGVAAPVFDRNSQVTAVITISGPSQRFGEETMKSCIALVVDVAEKLSNALGFRNQLG